MYMQSVLCCMLEHFVFQLLKRMIIPHRTRGTIQEIFLFLSVGKMKFGMLF